MQLNNFQKDSVVFVEDTVSLKNESDPHVFVGKNSAEDNSYPFSESLIQNHTPDWVLYFIISLLIVFAWLKIIYTRFIGEAMYSAINYQAAQRLFADPNLVKKRISFFFKSIYYPITGLFIYLVYRYFEWGFIPFKAFGSFLVLTTVLLCLTIVRMFLYKLTGVIFQQQKLFNEGLFHNSLYNQLSGIVLMPFILLIGYTKEISLDISVMSGIAAFTGVNLLRFYRASIFIAKNVVSILYFILYLCSLEILPVLVIIKLLHILAKVS